MFANYVDATYDGGIRHFDAHFVYVSGLSLEVYYFIRLFCWFIRLEKYNGNSFFTFRVVRFESIITVIFGCWFAYEMIIGLVYMMMFYFAYQITARLIYGRIRLTYVRYCRNDIGNRQFGIRVGI